MSKRSGESGLTLVEVMVVVALCCVGLAFWLSTPRSRGQRAESINCVNNLKQVGLSFRMWAGEHDDLYPMKYRTNDFDGSSYANSARMFTYFQVMSNELENPKLLICPGEKKSAATNFTIDFNGRKVSYFVGLDADETLTNTFLAGDSNLKNGLNPKDGLLELNTNQVLSWTKKRHQELGNIAFADGSVQKLSSSRAKAYLATTGSITNRIVLPP